MELIDRYIHEVGHFLPRKNRADIQTELRSLLSDALEDQAGEQPSEAEVAAVLKKFGSPRSVAAKYYPEGQYLIGPSLYPLFQMVAGIVIAAVTGAQAIAWLVAYFIAGKLINPLELISSIPATLGWLVVVFFILQRLDVQPDQPGEEWDPASLPQIDDKAEVNRSEHIASIIVESIILSIVVAFPNAIGGYISPGGPFFSNPLLAPYLGWIILSLLLSIGLDINLVWQGRWTRWTRLAQLATNLFSLILLAVLVQVHTAWLQAHGVTNFLVGIEALTQDIIAGGQIITVWGFWLGFSIALIVTVVETVIQLVRLLRSAQA